MGTAVSFARFEYVQDLVGVRKNSIPQVMFRPAQWAIQRLKFHVGLFNPGRRIGFGRGPFLSSLCLLPTQKCFPMPSCQPSHTSSPFGAYVSSNALTRASTEQCKPLRLHHLHLGGTSAPCLDWDSINPKQSPKFTSNCTIFSWNQCLKFKETSSPALHNSPRCTEVIESLQGSLRRKDLLSFRFIFNPLFTSSWKLCGHFRWIKG